MKTWSEIIQIHPIEQLLFEIIKDSVYRMQGLLATDTITHFELLCNLKYAYIFLSLNTKSHQAVLEKEVLEKKQLVTSMANHSDHGSRNFVNAKNWKYYQFNTDMEGIRELWRVEWGKLQKFLSDEMYDEYLIFLDADEPEANIRQKANESAFKNSVERVFERVKVEVLGKVADLDNLRCTIVFQEEYY